MPTSGEDACALRREFRGACMAAPLHASEHIAGSAKEVLMGTAAKGPLEDSINKALTDLETVSDEIRVKLHLAGMDAQDAWNNKLEPRLHEARVHAAQAKDASKLAIDDALKAFKAFAASL
jgi:hypothetical protein